MDLNSKEVYQAFVHVSVLSHKSGLHVWVYFCLKIEKEEIYTTYMVYFL